MKDTMIDLTPRWYNVKQVADLLGYSVSKVKTLIKSGELKSVKDGGNRRVIPRWVDEYIEHKTAQAEAHIDGWELAA